MCRMFHPKIHTYFLTVAKVSYPIYLSISRKENINK